MNILVIGATGVMGHPLVEILSKDNNITAISRHDVSDKKNVKYICGDAHDLVFMEKIIKKIRYDAIVDFMVYDPDKYEDVIELYLNNTKQYVFMSTACVYQEPKPGEKIDENTPLLWDSYQDDKKKQIDEYSVRKALLDRIILNSKYNNWTMIRPHITFNSNKIFLVCWFKEVFLYRALRGKKIVLPKDLMDVSQTITWGDEVALAISKLIGNEKAIGEIINIASEESVTWKQLVDIYSDLFPKICGKELKIKYVDSIKDIEKALKDTHDYNFQERTLRREFDMSKLKRIVGEEIRFTPIAPHLEKCLEECIQRYGEIIVPDEIVSGYMDHKTHSFTSLKDIKGKRNKIIYLLYRFGLNHKKIIKYLINY